MYLVVAGSGIGGMTLSSRMRIVAAGLRAGLDGDLPRRAVEVAGRLVPLLSLAAVHGQLDDVPVGSVERLVLVQQGLDPVSPGGNLAQALDRIAQRRRVDHGLLAGREPSTSMPKICWVFGAVVDLEPRLFLGIGREHDQQPAVERRLAELGPEADTDLDSFSLLRIVGGDAGTHTRKEKRERNRQERWCDGPPGYGKKSGRWRNGRSWFIFFSFQFVNIVEHTGRDADGQNGQLADGFVPGPSRNVNHDATVQLDDFLVEDHRALPLDDVIEFVGPLVVVQLGAVDLDVMDFSRGPVGLFDQRPNLAAGLRPGTDLGWIAAQELGSDVNGLHVHDFLSPAVAIGCSTAYALARLGTEASDVEHPHGSPRKRLIVANFSRTAIISRVRWGNEREEEGRDD